MVCVVVSCQSGSKWCKGPKYTLYRFRKSKWLKKKWIEAINREGFTPTESSVVCSKHFAEDAFEPSMVRSRGRSRKKRQLKKFAVPSLFLRPSQTPSEEENFSHSVPSTSDAAPTFEGDHSYSTGGVENDSDKLPPDSMVLNEIVVSGSSDKIQEEPAQENPPLTNCRDCIDSNKTKKDLLARIAILEQKNAELQEVKDKLETVWTKDMVRRMMLPSKSTKHYSTQTILECILIYYRIGTTAYEMLRDKGYPYPCLSTLKNHLRQVDCNPGILDDFFVFIKNQIAHLEDHHRYSLISGDEMSLKVKKFLLIIALVYKMFVFIFSRELTTILQHKSMLVLQPCQDHHLSQKS